MGGDLTNYGVGGDQQPYGLPSLPGMPEYGQNGPKYYPSLGAATIAQAQGAKGEPQLMDISASGDLNNPTVSVTPGAGGDSTLPALHKPSFGEAVQQGGNVYSNPALSKGGKLLSFLATIGRGAALGSGGGGFGQGAMIAAQDSARQQQERKNEILQRIQLARQAQQDARQAAEDKSQAELRQAQIDAYKSQNQKREEPKLYTVGGSLVDATGKPVYTSPAKPDTSVSAYEDFRASYPDTPAGRKQAALDYIAKTKPPKEGGPSKAQIVASQRHYTERLDALDRERLKSQTEFNPMSAEEYAARKKQIENDYQNELDTLGASPQSGSGGPPKGARIRNYTQF